MTVRAARLTPAGTGAIATVAIVGDGAWSVVQELFRTASGQPLVEPPATGSLRFGHFGPPPGDEVVLAVQPNRPEPWFEIHCHGGRVLVEWVLEQLAARGAKVVQWKELQSLEFGSLIRTAAAEALSQALTTKTANILLHQLNGSLDREIGRIGGLLDENRTNEAQDSLNHLVESWSWGRHLTTPLRVAFFGPPNAGKSSLINRLAGYQRAIVSPVAGTTRELTTTMTAIDGWPVELFDSPGVRDSGGPLEKEGMLRAITTTFDRIVWVVDGSGEQPVPPAHFSCDLMLINKCDLPRQPSLHATSIPKLEVSALAGSGIAELEAWIVGQLENEQSPEAAALFSQPLADAFLAASTALREGQLERTQQLLRTLVQPEKSQS